MSLDKVRQSLAIRRKADVGRTQFAQCQAVSARMWAVPYEPPEVSEVGFGSGMLLSWLLGQLSYFPWK